MLRGGVGRISRRWGLVRTMSSSIQWREGSEGVREVSVARFNAFLQRVREGVSGVAKGTRVHVMIGNEAADADSIVSSLVYAYFRDYVAKEERESKLFVPVLPIPRDELPLRCDVVALFQGLHIDTSSIFFVDEFPWRHEAFQSKEGESSLHMTLLDHNALNTKRIAEGLVAEDIGRIMEILDHHMDLGKHLEAPAREIAFQHDQALVASSCTLIAEKILAHSATKKVDEEVLALSATMLLGVIALDSINFDPSAKKVTPRDVAAANHLEAASFAQKGDLFRWLQSEKFNVAHWSAFSLNNCLVCDYKEFQLPEGSSGKYGVSAILIPLEAFVTKAKTGDDFVEQLQAYCEKDDLAFLVVMTMTVNSDGDRKRQILFYEANDQAHTKRCLQYFKSNDVLQLESTGLPYEFDERVSAFQQHNTGASRKQVVPLIQLALGTVAQVKL
ncbi:hypothetical protein Poli38472_014308 [Pythium oligandrum]|uniref:DHHA2 domain-containing protein n=1 Tax=Pythium oligandrum TaxID=41045 RepID=A0A8K1FBW6_PYTOL|nr:hypothetical protein Poli38472_014308 [Pythium oligandrum]|eukprot:TMW57705.1 hypothetical protein Poli38472_014308 [Pythium oligandrum]